MPSATRVIFLIKWAIVVIILVYINVCASIRQLSEQWRYTEYKTLSGAVVSQLKNIYKTMEG